MNRLTMLVLSSGVLLLAADERNALPSGLVVHEWGTFTSVAGEDGKQVAWDTLGCKNDLPKFVHDYGFRSFKWTLHGSVRMETPVLYFYTAQDVDAHVKVSFPQGLITEWYPQADYRIDQKNSDGSMHRVNTSVYSLDSTMRNLTGSIEWNNIQVRPGATFVFPFEKSSTNRYYAARATDSAPITVAGQHEKFLFYRGSANFPVLLSAVTNATGAVTIDSVGREPIPLVMLFENRGGRIGYRSAIAMK